MSPLGVFVHVTTKDFWFKMVDIFVEKPDWGIIGIRQGVWRYEAPAIALTLGHQPGDLSWRSQIKLQPFIVWTMDGEHIFKI